METQTGGEIEASTEKLLRDLKAVLHDSEELLRAGARDVTERGRAARDRLAEAVEIARQTQRRLQAQAVASAKLTGRVVREHPYESMGVAFGIGVLFGLLTSRR
jgi:ElaB/YqjD/DUF883 family membrane-anchored ribosome-binding protein